MLGSKREVLISISLRVNNGSRARRLVSDHVRGVRQTREIELLKDQPALPLVSLRSYFHVPASVSPLL
jgi:hypothetical protein